MLTSCGVTPAEEKNKKDASSKIWGDAKTSGDENNQGKTSTSVLLYENN